MEFAVSAVGNRYLRILRILWTVLLLTVVSVNAVCAGLRPGPPGRHVRGTSAKNAEFVADELIVKFKAGVSEQKKRNVHARHGGKKLREWKSLRLQHLKLKAGDKVQDALARYSADPDVEYAEPNYLLHANSAPNDPMFPSLWGMQKIAASAGWDYSTGDKNVVVAVIDTGVDYTHLDLQANMWVNPGEIAGNGIDDDGNGYVDDVYGINTVNGTGKPLDDHGHGTHVAGTIGAAGNNGIGVAGVNWSVKIIACKFLSSGGSGYVTDAVNCLQYVRALKDRGVNIVATSNSWGGGGYSQALYDAIEAQQDILFVAAAGNDGADIDKTPHYPSSYQLPNVISVGATDSNDLLASFSNRGRYGVDIAAPGVDVLSTLPASNTWGLSGGYGTLSGTSMATPHVTGLAALLKAQDPARQAAQIKNLIFSGGDDVAALAGTSLTGKRINILNSLSGSNRTVLSLGWLPSHVSPGKTYPLSAFSVDGGLGAPVTVTGSDGTLLQLSDSGVAPDDFAGDSVFTGAWTPLTVPVTLTFSSSAGSKSVTMTDLAVSEYLADASQDVPYSQQLRASGGTAPYSWSIAAGTLPAGLALDPATGVLSGTASVPGTYPFAVQVTDAKGTSATGSFNFLVDGGGWSDQKWGGIYDRSSDEKALGMATDAAGNSYVVGEAYNGKDMDVMVTKYDPAGTVIWSRTYDGGSYESGRSIALDRSTGNVYVAGVSGIPGDHLLLRYDSSGNLIWKKSWDRGGDDIAWGVTTGPGGTVYTVGTVDTPEGGRVLLAKYDSAGNTLWAKVHQDPGPIFTVPYDEYGYAAAVDGGGNLYFGGTRMWYDANSVRSASFLIAKYDAAGNVLWSKRPYPTDSSRSNVIKAIATDDAGGAYATGWSYWGSADREGPIVTPQTGRTGMVLKVDAAGNTVWSAAVFDWCEAIAVSGEKVYVGCEENDVIELARFTTAGKMVWTRPLDPGGISAVRSIAADGAGFWVAGYRDNGADTDAIVARYEEVAPLNDLSVPSVSGTLSASGYLTYSATVRNSGSGNPYANVGIYLSPTATPKYTDYLVDYRRQLRMAANADTAVSASVSASASVPSGTYYLTAIADPPRWINDKDWTNNSGAGPFITLTCDLAVTNVAATVSDGVLTYSVTVQNRGRNKSAQSTTAIQFSSNGGSSNYLVTSVSTPGIDAGKEGVLIGTAAVPASIPPGTYAVAAVADAANSIHDTDATNNRGVGNSVALPVDLSVTALSGSVAGGKLSFTAKVKNNGLQTVSPSVALYFSPDAAASTDDYLVTVLGTGNISGGGEGAVSGTVDVPAAIPGGSYYLAALADPANAIAETDESNNGRVAGSYLLGTRRTSLDYSVTGTGSGTVVFIPGASCAGSCSQSYDAGTSVTLTAVAASGSSFAGWGGACTGTGACTVTMDLDKQVSASFVKKPAISYTPTGAGTGTVTFEPGTSCAGACSQPYEPGTQVTLAAVAGTGSVFTGWGGACSGTGSCVVAADVDKAVVATFQPVVPKVSAGSCHTVAQTGDTVWSWGYNAYGQLGDGTTADHLSPRQLTDLSGIASIVIPRDGSYTLGLREDGTLWSWGQNYYGQLGDASNTNRSTPVQVSGLTQVIAAGGGSSFAMALKGDGTVWTWGINNRGQMGDGTNTPYPFLPSRTTPLPVPGLTNVVAISSGEEHIFALKGDGTVWGWGSNEYGVLGNGSNNGFVTRPVPLPGLSDIVAISGGKSHTVALKKDGTVWAWGYNYYGELGDGTTVSRWIPAQVPGLSGVVAIAVAYHHTLALKNDGTVWAWGWNNYGEIGNGTSGGGWSMVTTPAKVTGLDNVVGIAAGLYHSVAVKADATIWSWGDNRYGQLGDGTLTNRSTPVRVTLDVAAPATTASPAGGTYETPQTVTLSANEPATIYYTLDGSTPTTGSPVYSAPVTVFPTATLRFFAVDSAGNREGAKAETYLLAASGPPTPEFSSSANSGDIPFSVTFSDLSTGSPSSWLWDFGDNSTGTSPNPVHTYTGAGSYTVSLTVTNSAGSATRTRTEYIIVRDPGRRAVVAGLTAGDSHSGAVIDGRIATWGSNIYGQLGDSTGRTLPNVVPGLSGLSAVAQGSEAYHTVVVGSGGTVWAWGRNYAGEIGDGTATQRNTPYAVSGLPEIAQVSTGYFDSMALGKEGAVWSWGSNASGKLGDGTLTERRNPVQVAGLSGIAAIAAGRSHSVALASGGTVWTWGFNDYGQLGDGTTTTRSTAAQVPGLAGVVAIAAGTYHTVALKGDGTVWTWGGNWLGQIGDGTTVTRTTPFQVPGLSGVIAIAAGSDYTVAVKADGTVWEWGGNNYGQLGDGTTTNRTAPVQVPALTGVVKIAAGRAHVVALTQDGTLWAWGKNAYGQLGDGTTTTRTTPVRVIAVDTVAPVTTAYPAGGSYAAPQSVTLAVNEAATIYYTLDGSTPTTSSPVYTAPLDIGFSTTLRYFAKDKAGNSEDFTTQVYRIAATEAPTAAFGASVTKGGAPLSVAFSDLSAGAPSSWLWNFGDSTTSTARNPVHIYTAPGAYTVSLTVSNALGSDTRTMSNYITALDPGPSPLQPAYNSAVDGGVIRVRLGQLFEDPVFDRDITVKIGGGYDFLYKSRVGATVLHGKMRIRNGKVSLENLILQ